MGANGAGKSTLVKILTGAVRPTAGKILIRGEARDVHSPAEARRAGLVSVYQEPAIIPDLDVASNLRLTETPVEPFRRWVEELGVPDLDLRETARNIPLAILRVLDLARALAIEPDVLLLDEMTAALPANLAEKVLDVVKRQSKTGRSVIFISHRLLEISALCDRATVLRDGETVGVVDMGAGRRGADRRADARRARSRRICMPSRERRPQDRERSRRTARRASASATCASGRSSRTSRSISMPARCSALVALEGQGQDELFGVLSGSSRPSGGTIEVEGRAVQFGHPADAIRDGPGARPRRPHRGASDAALGAREHRPAVQRALLAPGVRSTSGGRKRASTTRSAACRSTRARSARCSGSPAATSRR